MPITNSKPNSDNSETLSSQKVQYVAPYGQHFEDDSIDLYDLWIILWKKKWFVIAVTAILTLGSVVYALLSPQIYNAEALLLPPKEKDIKSLNMQGIHGYERLQVEQGIQLVTTSRVFNSFKKNLSSRSIQKKFIEKYDLLDILAPNRTPETRDIEILESFAKMIKIESESESESSVLSVSMESDDPVFAAKLVNDYVSFFDLETVHALISDVKHKIEEQIKDIEYKISSKQQMAKLRREDQVERYQEASMIANSLGIKRRVDATNIIQNTQMNVDIATSTTPLYYLGLKALSAEINILRNRKSDDPFISGLRDLQEKLALLRSIRIEAGTMHSVTIDQAAYPPKNHIKPNRRLIVSLGPLVGLFLGIFLALFVSFVQKEKEIHSK